MKTTKIIVPFVNALAKTLAVPSKAASRLYVTIFNNTIHKKKQGIKGSTTKENTIPTISHYAVGIIKKKSASITNFALEEIVMLQYLKSCGSCAYCIRGMFAHCHESGWKVHKLKESSIDKPLHVYYKDKLILPV